MNHENTLTNKKAVSPLVATVLLIAFAVALGALALTFAQQIFYVEVDCDNVKFTLRPGVGEPSICYTDTHLIFYAANEGENIPIDNFRVIITPKSLEPLEFDQTFNNPGGENAISPGAWRKVSVPYSVSEHQEIEEVDIVPKVRKVLDDPLSEWKACAIRSSGSKEGNILTIKNVPRCT